MLHLVGTTSHAIILFDTEPLHLCLNQAMWISSSQTEMTNCFKSTRVDPGCYFFLSSLPPSLPPTHFLCSPSFPLGNGDYLALNTQQIREIVKMV